MLYTAYHDRKIICFISNFIGIDSKLIDENKPLLCSIYNKWMNAVDLFDARFNLHLFRHRKEKWTLTYFIGMLNVR